MKTKTLFWENQETIFLLTKLLEEEKTAITSTDTVIGLLANTSQEGFNQLNKIKKRSAKSYIILVNSIDKLSHFAQVPPDNKKLQNLMKSCWPGPVTLIFKSKKELPKYLCSENDTVAIRIPNHPYLLQLLTFFNGLFSTSANITNKPIPETIDEIDIDVKEAVKYIVVNKNDLKTRYSSTPSTIIDCTNENIKVIRQGAFFINDL